MLEQRGRVFDVEMVFASVSQNQHQKLRKNRRFRGSESPLYTAVCPMIYVIRVFGLAPYEFNKDRLVPSDLFSFVTLFVGLIYTGIMCNVFHKVYGAKQKRALLGGTELFKVILNYVVVMFDLIHAVTTRTHVTKIWNVVQDYDEHIRQLGYSRTEGRLKFCSWCVFLFYTIIWTLVNRVGMQAFSESYFYNFSYMFIYIGNFVSVYKFVGLATIFGQRFHHLNGIARKSKPSREGYKTAAGISMQTIQKLHNDLLEAAEELAPVFSWSLIMWLGNLSFHTVCNVFLVVDWLVSVGEIPWLLITCFSFWLMIFITQILALNYACDYAATEANAMAAILLDWELRLSRQNEKMRPKTSLHLLNRSLSFTAAGCFRVNLPLLRSITALLSTYLVLLLQFPES